MARPRLLWLAAAALFPLLAALPGTRDVVSRRDLAAGCDSGSVMLVLAESRPGLFYQDWTIAPAEATARRLNAAWAYAAAAEETDSPAAGPALLDQAVRMDPRDELLWLARAEEAVLRVGGAGLTAQYLALSGERPARTRQPAPAALARVELTTAELVGAFPDNAFGRWLRAYSLALNGDGEAAERELRAAATCPRLRTGCREQADRRRRFAAARGLPRLEATVHSRALACSELMPLGDLAKWAAARAYELADRRRAADLSLSVCRFGTRLRDADGSLQEMLCGAGCFIVGELDPTRPRPGRSPGLAGEAELRWYARWYSEPFLTRLRQSGRGDAVAWATAEADRCATLWVAASREMMRGLRPNAATTATALALGLGRVALLVAALALLLHAAVWEVLRRRQGGSLVPWRLRELLVLSLAAAGPLALAMVLVWLPVVRTAVVDEQTPTQLQHWPLGAVFALFGLSLLAVPLLLGTLARCFARRGGAEDLSRAGRRAVRRHFRRRTLPGAFAGTAALLVMLAVLTSVPIAACRAHFADLAIGLETAGTGVARQAVRAIPAPEPPADLRPARR